MEIYQYFIASLVFDCLVSPNFIKHTYASDISTSDNVETLDYSTNRYQESSKDFLTNANYTNLTENCSLKVTDKTTLVAPTNGQILMTLHYGDISIDQAETLKFQTNTRITRVEMTTEALSPLNVLSKLDRCAQYGTCKAILENKFRLQGYQYCRCDSACSVFNDCCLDSKFTNNFSTKEHTFVCAPLKIDPRDLVNKYRGIYLIDNCPGHIKNTEIRNKCYQNLTEAGPYVSTADGTVYKNRYCASCNGVDEFALFSVKVAVEHIDASYSDMNPFQFLQGLLSNPDVAYVLVPPVKIEWRSCLYTELVDSNISNCMNYIVNPVVAGGTLKALRNYFCRPSAWVSCFVDYISFIRDWEIYPLSVIFSFSSTNDGDCRQGEEKKNGICQAVPLFINETVSVTVQLNTTSNVNATVMKQILVSFYFSFSVPSVIEIYRFACANVTRTPHNGTILVFISLRFLKPMSAKEVLFVKKKLQQLSWKSYINEVITMDTTELSVVYKPFTDDIFWEFGGKSLNDSMNLLRVQSYENTSLTLCTDIVVHSFLSNQTLTIQKIECLDNVMYGSQYVTGNLIKSVITYVGSCVSVTALLVSVAVSRKLKLTNSIPGNNLENLSCSLIVSSVLFMAGVGTHDYQRVCYVIGIALHYLWLVTFSFMSIAVVYVVQNIRKMVANVSHDLVSREKYALTGLGLVTPILFVLPSVLLDYYDVENFSAMYAGLICFPTGFLPNMIFVTGPIVISMIVNLAFLIVIIIYVTRHTMTMNHVRKSHSYQQGKVYLRICSIAGVFWLTGVLGAIFKSELIDYIFLVLCSLQGFAVAVGNLGTRRVITGFRKDLKTSNKK